MRSKKGATPILATILLFFFALTIGFIIDALQNEEVDYNAVCDQLADVRIVETEPFCITDSDIYFTLENNAQNTVFGLHVTFITDKHYVIRDFNKTLISGDDVFIRYPIPYVQNLSQLSISVYRQSGLDLIKCPTPSVIVSSFPQCAG